MKRILSLLLSLALLFSLCACGGNENSQSGQNPSGNSSNHKPASTPVPTSVPQESLEVRAEKLANKTLKTLYNGWNIDGVMKLTLPSSSFRDEVHQVYEEEGYLQNMAALGYVYEYVSSEVEYIHISDSEEEIGMLNSELEALGFSETVTAVIECDCYCTFKLNGELYEDYLCEVFLIDTNKDIYVAYVEGV